MRTQRTPSLGTTPRTEAEYVRKIEDGEYPWYCLGVHVYVCEHESDQGRYRHPRREIGSAYLGCCDTFELRALGVRDVAREAIQDARSLLEVAR